jgi:signal transduction histidine kinase/DNA-binding response OmpR family regulator
VLKSARLSIAIIGVLLAMLTAAIVFTNQALENNKVLNGWVQHTYEVIEQANQVLTDLVEAETSRRGYMMSPQPIYLDSYQRNTDEAKSGLERLNGLVGDNAEQLGHMHVVRDLVERRLVEMEEGMRHWRGEGLAGGINHLNDSETRAITIQSRTAILKLIETEARLLNDRKMAAENGAERTQIWTIVIFIIAVTGILLALYLLSRSNHQLSRTQTLLRSQAAMLQRTLDSCSEGIAAFDSGGRISTYNRNFFTLLDYPGNLGTQRAMFDEFTKFDDARTAELLRKVSMDVDSSTKQRTMLGDRFLELYRNPMPDGGFLVVCEDLTAHHHANAILRQSQKMDSIGQLTGGIAHDFNNLLQVISSNLTLLQRDIADTPKAMQRYNHAAMAVERGAKLTRQLLAFARRQPLEPHAINLSRIIGDTTELLRHTLGEDVEIETVVAGGLWNTLVDPTQVENVIVNLAINARDAMAGGGKLTIELANAYLDETYASKHVEVTAGQYVMLAVSDTGSGMTPEVAERAFEPFFTTKGAQRGTGLGLSQVYGFVKQSGGHIKLYTELGHGTTFKIYLPRTRQPDEFAESVSLTPVSGGSETVLVVEDDETVRAAASDMLAEMGYRILQADNPDAALAVLRSGATIDLLFTDVVMPGNVSTRDMARAAKEIHPRLQVLFTSGYTSNSIVHDGRLDDGVSLLSKPYTKDELARKTRSVLDAAETRQRPRESYTTSGVAPYSTQTATTVAPAKSAERPLRVLVVDDEPFIRFGTVDILTDLNHMAEEAGDAETALDRLGREPQFDILITDLKLPGMSGEALASHALRVFPDIQVIIASGSNPELSLTEKYAAERVTIVRKPFQVKDLEDALKRLFG